MLNDIKRRFREETFTRESIMDAIVAYPELVRLLYVNFAMVHYPESDGGEQLVWVFFIDFMLQSIGLTTECRPTLSYQRLRTEQPLSTEELHDKIRRTVPNKHEVQVLESFLIFNQFVVFF